MEKEKRAKSPKFSLEGLKEAREGKVSRLDQLELDEDDNVYDVVDEEKYSKIVEERRKGVDFVVDDDGLGYYDNGEEVLGAGEDAYDIKKRLKEAGKQDDMKVAKRARKLAEDVVMQKNTMLKHLTTGHTATPKLSTRESGPQQLLDIDALLSNKPQESTSRAKPLLGPMGLPRPRPMGGMRRPGLPTLQASFGMNRADETEEVPSAQTNDEFPDYHMDMSTDEQHDHSEALSQNHTTPDKGSASSPAAIVEVTPEAHIPVKEEIHQKLSLTKTNKSFKITAPAPKPVTPEEPLKSLFNAAQGNNVPSFVDSDAPVAVSGGQKIDPRSWLLESPAEVLDAPEEKYVRMYWIDATEVNGVVYLFGRVPVASADAKQPPRYVSCCAVVQGCERNLFVLPRAQPDKFKEDGTPLRKNAGEVYQEISKLLVPSIIPKQQGQAFKAKPVTRKYAFEHDFVPREATEYLKVIYSAKHGVPSPPQCQGGNSYEAIFGAGLSPLELFLLKRQMQGPCWIHIKAPRVASDAVSWCKVEFIVDNPKNVSKVPQTENLTAPPLVSMCVSIKTVVNPATHLHEIVAMSALVHAKVDTEAETESNTNNMKRITFIRALGLSCGNSYPTSFPHNIHQEVPKHKEIALQTFNTERELLSMFLNRVMIEDPDIFASHNLIGFEFDVLLARLVANKLPNWSLLGRLRKSKEPKSIMDKDVTAGRILCDTYKAAKEFLRETTYSLTHLANSQLKKERAEVDPIAVPRYFSNANDIIGLAWHTYRDAWLVQGLMFKLQVVPLTKQLTNISGNLWSRTIKGARAERIEYLLLHEFHSLKYILPERKLQDFNKNSKNRANMEDDEGNEVTNKVGGMSRKRAKAAYAGGLVLEPKKGLYDTYILLLDFNSLYPSIIQEYNLCFTTVEWTKYMPKENGTVAEQPTGKNSGKGKKKGDEDEDEEGEDSDDENVAENGTGNGLPPLPDSNSSQPGILPRVIKALVDRRRTVKNLLKNEKDPVQRQLLDIRQKALKLTANSMYGCLGFSFSRFYARPIAALVTAMGREALQRTVDLATNQMGLDVIYGDTDSVMINTNLVDLQQVKEIGNKVKREVNKLYKSLELDLDGIFRSMLLLKKKKYAALTIHELGNGQVEYEKELKGLDLVRRDWCPMSKDAGKYVVDQILSGQAREEIVMAIHDYLADLAGKIRNNEVPLEAYIITKGLNKNPKDYPDSAGQPHLQVALQMLKANKPVNIGDHIPYIICTQSTGEGTGNNQNSIVHRAYHPDEVERRKGELMIDYEWYLSTQILPPISRLCEPIEGTSAAIISEKLGLDANKYARGSSNNDDYLEDAWGYTPTCQLDDAERFKGVEKLIVKCSACKQDSEVDSVMEVQQVGHLLTCKNCQAIYFGRYQASDCYCYLSNRVTLLIRQCVKKYYDCWLKCDDSSCNLRTLQHSVAGAFCISEGCTGRLKQEYDELQLHNQLKYLEALFDVKRFQSRKNIDDKALFSVLPRDHIELLRLLKEHMYNTIKNSAYNWVRPSLWTALFGKLEGKNNAQTAKSLM